MNNPNTEKRLQSKLRTCQLMQVELLKLFDRICRKHKLAYWIDGGTLLGAVRHGGFIPWDDDVDVAMSSIDFKTFMEVAQAELPEGIFLQTRKSDPTYPQHFIKLLNLNSLFLSAGDDLSLPYQKCIYIDIFEFVDYPTLPQGIIKKLALQISSAQYHVNTRHYFSFPAVMAWAAAKMKLVLLKKLWRLCCLLPGGKYTANIIEDNGYGIVHALDNVYPLRSIRFEDAEFISPGNPDAYLKDLYGDYMDLPPVEKRISHAIYIETKVH